MSHVTRILKDLFVSILGFHHQLGEVGQGDWSQHQLLKLVHIGRQWDRAQYFLCALLGSPGNQGVAFVDDAQHRGYATDLYQIAQFFYAVVLVVCYVKTQLHRMPVKPVRLLCERRECVHERSECVWHTRGDKLGVGGTSELSHEAAKGSHYSARLSFHLVIEYCMSSAPCVSTCCLAITSEV